MASFYIYKEGRKFLVEPISKYASRGADWGDSLTNRPKQGAIHPSDSVITPENGFINIITTAIGESPMSAVDKILATT